MGRIGGLWLGARIQGGGLIVKKKGDMDEADRDR